MEYYGAGKAGGTFDIQSFVLRPHIICRFLCWLFAIVVFGCISSQGWRMDPTSGKDICILNKDDTACNFPVLVGVFGFLASMAFLVGEYLFEQMSSVKSRKHYVLVDLGFSALWAFLFFIAFCYMSSAWSKADGPPGGYGVSNMNAAIFFALISIFTWTICAYFAFVRFKAGAAGIDQLPYGMEDQSNQQAVYSSYPDANDNEQYNEPPFSSAQRGQMEFQAPAY